MSRFLSRLALAALAPLAACDLEDDVACTREARVSVTVNVTDPGGAPISDVQVSYVGEDGSGDDCETYEAGVYLCGYEVAGDLAITVEVDGEIVATESVLVDADECHVISETIDVVVPPTA